MLPFGFKQIKSMQHMQALQPKIKDLQKKYKSNKQKQQEETMKLYKEAGVNPLGGCLPMLLTLPFLFAMYAVIRPPVLAPAPTQRHGQPAYVVVNNHLPIDSTLFYNVVEHQNLDFAVGQSAVFAQLVRAPTSSSRTAQASRSSPGQPILGAGDQPVPGEPDVPVDPGLRLEEVPGRDPVRGAAPADAWRPPSTSNAR